jgi:hypothetical protein
MLLLPQTLSALSMSHVLGSSIEPRDPYSTGTPTPISFSPDQNFDGIDGSWSSFTLRIGEPQPQYVRTFASWTSYQTIAVIPAGCNTSANYQECSDARGWIYDETKSKKFANIGLYGISIEENLGYKGNAIYGYDTVGLGGAGEEGPNATTGKGQIPNVIRTPPPASLTIPSYPTAFSKGTAFAYFSNYEIISKTVPLYGEGPLQCATFTKTYSLETPFAFPYAGSLGNESGIVGADVTGDVDPALLGVVGQESAVPGSWVAAPTVAIIVQDVFAAEAVLAASIEASQKSLLTPSATLPLFLSPVHPKTTEDHPPKGNTKGHTETTAKFLLVPTPASEKTNGGGGAGTHKPKTTTTMQPQGGEQTVVPFVAHLEHSEFTLQVPAPGTRRIITTEFRGVTITASRVPQGNKPDREKGRGPGGRGSVSVHAVQGEPTNAFEVLSQAEESLKQSVKNARQSTHTNAPDDRRTRSPGGGSGKIVPVIVIGQTTFTGNAETRFSLPSSKTLTPGGTAKIDGTSLSLLPHGSSVVINGHTEAISRAVITPAPVLTIASRVYHPIGGPTYVIGGQTLTPGGVISVKGTFVSLAPGLSKVVINALTQNLAGTDHPSPAVTSPPILTIGGETFSAINHGATYVVNGKTLTPGDEETIKLHGKTYIVSLAPGATVLKIETVGPNGKVTATTSETLYPGVGRQATITSTVGAATASAASKHGQTGSAQSTGPAPNLQNEASLLGAQLGPLALMVGSFVFAIWS